LGDGISKKEDDTYSPRRISLSILAEWGNPDLSPLFIRYIDYVAPDPQLMVANCLPHERFAAVKGLINIGSSAIPDCLKEIAHIEKAGSANDVPANEQPKSDSKQSQFHLTYVIWSISGYRKTVSIFEREIRRIEPQDPVGAKNLKEAIDNLSSFDYYRQN
jgi:hypothetical protein